MAVTRSERVKRNIARVKYVNDPGARTVDGRIHVHPNSYITHEMQIIRTEGPSALSGLHAPTASERTHYCHRDSVRTGFAQYILVPFKAPRLEKKKLRRVGWDLTFLFSHPIYRSLLSGTDLYDPPPPFPTNFSRGKIDDIFFSF